MMRILGWCIIQILWAIGLGTIIYFFNHLFGGHWEWYKIVRGSLIAIIVWEVIKSIGNGLEQKY